MLKLSSKVKDKTIKIKTLQNNLTTKNKKAGERELKAMLKLGKYLHSWQKVLNI